MSGSAAFFTQAGPIDASQLSTSHQRRDVAFDLLARPTIPDFHCPEGYTNCGVRDRGVVCAAGRNAEAVCASMGPADPRSTGDGLIPIAHPAPPGMGWCGGYVQNFVPAGQNFSRDCMGEMPPARQSGQRSFHR